MIRSVLLAGLLTLGRIQQDGKERGVEIVDHNDQMVIGLRCMDHPSTLDFLLPFVLNKEGQ